MCVKCNCSAGFHQLTIIDLPAYVFLTLFTSLIPTLFYFSIWELGLAGTELTLFSVLSPFLLAHSSVSAFAKCRAGQVILQALSLSGLLVYPLGEPLTRLIVVAPAVALATLAAAAKWTEADGGYQAISMFSTPRRDYPVTHICSIWFGLGHGISVETCQSQ
jgi:hypothetical protein